MPPTGRVQSSEPEFKDGGHMFGNSSMCWLSVRRSDTEQRILTAQLDNLQRLYPNLN